MTYQVKAPLVLAADENGVIHYRYRDSLIGWLSDEDRDRFLADGLVEEVEGGSEDSDVVESTPTDPVAPQRPHQTATKDEWVEYAVASGKFTREAAEASTKADLIAAL